MSKYFANKKIIQNLPLLKGFKACTKLDNSLEKQASSPSIKSKVQKIQGIPANGILSLNAKSIVMGVDHLNNNDSLIVSNSDAGVNKCCRQVPDQLIFQVLDQLKDISSI